MSTEIKLELPLHVKLDTSPLDMKHMLKETEAAFRIAAMKLAHRGTHPFSRVVAEEVCDALRRMEQEIK